MQVSRDGWWQAVHRFPLLQKNVTLFKLRRRSIEHPLPWSIPHPVPELLQRSASCFAHLSYLVLPSLVKWGLPPKLHARVNKVNVMTVVPGS
jgi:hypothetical protein